MSIVGSFKANRSSDDFGERELAAGVLAAEEILAMEGFSLGVRVGSLEDAEWSGRNAEDVVGKQVFYLISGDGEYLDGMERQVFLSLGDVLEKLSGFHDGVLGEYYEDVKDGHGKLGKKVEKALILLEDKGYVEDLWKAINAEVYQDVYLNFIGKNRDDLRLVHQLFFAGERMEYGGFDGIGRATFDAIGYLADRCIAGKIAETQSAYQVIEYDGLVCEVYVDNGDIGDFQKEILDGTLLKLGEDIVCPFETYRGYIEAQVNLVIEDMRDIGLYESDGSWGFYLTEIELRLIGLGAELEKELNLQRPAQAVVNDVLKNVGNRTNAEHSVRKEGGLELG